jgi:hypothetical protein
MVKKVSRGIAMIFKHRIMSIVDKDPGHAYDLIMEYQSRIDLKDIEIASLKEQLAREMTTVDWYADGNNWSYVNQHNKTLMKADKDIEWIPPGVFTNKFAGKLARSTQRMRE